MTPYQTALCVLFAPLSEAPAWQWIEDTLELGSNSELKRFDFTILPMHKWVHERMQDATTRRFVEMICAQGGKTVNMLAHIVHKASQNPRDIAWYTDTSIKAVADYKTKIRPFFENCRGVSALFPRDRTRRSQKLIQFDTMNMHILGAESSSNRESITLFEAYCDEVRNYPPGALTQIENRMKTIKFSRLIVFSSAGNEFDELHRAWAEGTRHLFMFRCPKCQHQQTLRFGRDPSPMYPEPREHGGFIWETNDTTRPTKDTWNFQELAKTVRYECENADCLHQIHPADRAAIIATLEPVQTNPHADPSHISVHWWEAHMPWADCSWPQIVIKFLRANAAVKRGDFEPLRSFVCETLGEPWRPPGGHKVDPGELAKRMGTYAMGETWDHPQAIQVITVDVQQGHIYYLRRAIVPGVGSRMMDCGTMPGFEDLRAYQVAHGVMDCCVFIDCAYRPTDVFEACLQHGRWVNDPERPHPPFGGARWDGWTPIRGSDFDECSFRIQGQPIKSRWRFYDHDTQSGKSRSSKYIRLFEYSKPFFRDQLFLYAITGHIRWELPRNTPDDYIKQMQNVERRELLDLHGQVIGHEYHEKGRHDYPDCEQMQMAVIAIAELN